MEFFLIIAVAIVAIVIIVRLQNKKDTIEGSDVPYKVEVQPTPPVTVEPVEQVRVVEPLPDTVTVTPTEQVNKVIIEQVKVEVEKKAPVKKASKPKSAKPKIEKPVVAKKSAEVVKLPTDKQSTSKTPKRSKKT